MKRVTRFTALVTSQFCLDYFVVLPLGSGTTDIAMIHGKVLVYGLCIFSSSLRCITREGKKKNESVIH